MIFPEFDIEEILPRRSLRSGECFVRQAEARPLKKLAIVHLAAVTCCAIVTDIDRGTGVQAAINMLFTALVGSDLCLLGLGMAAIVEWPPRRKRISFLLNGMAWIWVVTLFVMARTRSFPPPFIFLLPPLVSFAALVFGMALRLRGVGLVATADPLGDSLEPLQFTLHRLLSWVTATAVLLAIARGLHSTMSLHVETSVAFTFAVLGVMSLITAGIVLATLWATLGVGRPVQRLPLAVSLAAIGGLAPPYCLGRPSPWAYLLLAVVAAMLSAIAATTLLFVRKCGYRLVDTRGSRLECA